MVYILEEREKTGIVNHFCASINNLARQKYHLTRNSRSLVVFRIETVVEQHGEQLLRRGHFWVIDQSRI